MDKTARLPRRALVTDSQELTPTGTFLVSFQVVDDEPFDFEPCEFVAIDCENKKYGYRRSPYCIFSSPDADRTFALLARRITNGPVSLFLGKLNVGDVISFRGPTGPSMVPTEPDTELVLLATGVGVSPFHSLVHYLLPRGFKRRIQLYWGLRLQGDICLLDDLDELQSRYSNFTYEISLSRPAPDWQGLRGRVTESVPPLLKSLRNTHFYLCGNGAMIAEMSAVLSELGIPKSLLFEEYFFNFHHVPGPRKLNALRSRFIAHDLFSPIDQALEAIKSLHSSEES
ncbi:MAG: ferredoxin--NADP reductase [bacterium]